MSPTHSEAAMRPLVSEAGPLALPPAPPDLIKHPPNKAHPALVVPAPTTMPPGVDFRPAALASRQSAAWRAIRGEVVRISRAGAFEFEYCGSSHLLIVYHRAVRKNGDTMLDSYPPSTLHHLSRKLTFVPAGSRIQERHEPGEPFRATFLYIDPSRPLLDTQPDLPTVRLQPRVFFENPALWETSLKLNQLIEAGLSDSCYAEALGVVLAHELTLLDNDKDLAGPVLQGGLANWQQRAVARYIEENLEKNVSLTKLADIARLSPYHFSRTFKKSFGIPPRRYHMARRLEWARRLLAEPSLSITDIGLRVGFADTSTFSVAFRNLVGRSPREYRRGLF